MCVVAVHSAIRQQTHKVKRGAVLFAVFHSGAKNGILIKITVMNGFGDMGELLIDYPAGAHVGVADLAVTHLPVRQTDIQTRGTYLRHGACRHISVKVRLFRRSHGIAVIRRVEAEAVHYYKRYGSFHKR